MPNTLQLCVSSQENEQRLEIKNFIHTCYAKNYGADIQYFMPTLIAVRNRSGCLLAALGLRSGGYNPLFLEQYLPKSTEIILKQRFNQEINRQQLVEIGNLASVHTKAMQWLFLEVNTYLYQQHYQWAVSTVISKLHRHFRRQGLNLITLAAAKKQILNTTEQAMWGSYYEKTPLVVAGNIVESYHQFKQNPHCNR